MEHSVPAGDKGEACQGPHSSELTHTVMHVTHIHTYSHHYFTLFSAFSLFSFTIPFLLPLSFSSPLCHILLSDFHFFSVLYASYFFACLHVSSVTPPCLTVHSVWEGYSQFRCKNVSQNPLSTVGNAPAPSTSSAVYARMMRFPLPEPAVMKAGCRKSICWVVDFRNFSGASDRTFIDTDTPQQGVSLFLSCFYFLKRAPVSLHQ